MGIPIGFNDSNGSDIGMSLVEKSYLIDRYPELADTYRFAGLWGWGLNGNGQLGNNIQGANSSPIQTIAGGTNWKYVFCGNQHVTSIKTDGTLWTWGYNGFGQLGDNTAVDKSSPVQVTGGGTNWKQVSCGYYHTAAIKTDGTLWIWGYNLYGQLGDNTAVNKSSPVTTSITGSTWVDIASGRYHTIAIKTDGTLWTWGYNFSGQLGLNDTTSRSTPVQEVTGGTNWKQVSSGVFYTAAIKKDGTLWSWGNNGNGQLGINSTANTSTPVQTVAGGTNWKQLSCGGFYTAAIKTDGTLWLWGNNGNGQLGDNTIVTRSTPVQVTGGGTNWIHVACGGAHTFTIRDDSMDLL